MRMVKLEYLANCISITEAFGGGYIIVSVV